MKSRLIGFSILLIGLVSLVSYAQAAVPLINQPLVPDATAPGGPGFTLTVNGTGFVSGSVVNWNGSARATTVVNGSRLKAAILAADIATAGTAWVTVASPPPGGGTSNVAFFTVTANTGDSVAFSLVSSLITGQDPSSVAVGDFNGDGKLDLAVANMWGGTVSILLGDGKGNFTLASSPHTGNTASSVAVGDFNGDGKLDLAVANMSDATVSILLGDGTGNFTLASSLAVGSWPISVAVGDFNGDGKLDLAVANMYGPTVSILLGDGTGNFTLASSPATGSWPSSVAMGDFNGDGKLDLATANCVSDTVSILLGDGTGNFTLGSSPAVGSCPLSVTAGDFNGDGSLDLAVANQLSNTVSILLGDGKGNFSLASSPSTGSAPSSVAVGDFNGDGKLDLAIANYTNYTVSVLLGDGAGQFSLASSPTAGNYPRSVAVGDFNEDGKLDLAVANFDDVRVSILLQGPPPPSVTLFPAGVDFGSQPVGTTSAPLIATVSNTTSGSVTINGISITGADSGDYSQTNNCGTSLVAGTSCSISITFTPTATGTRSATLNVTDSDPSSPQTSSLTGIGTQGQPAVTLSPPSLTFPWQPINTGSPALPVTLTNTGGGTLTISGFGVAGSFSQTNTCGSSVAPGGSCTINVVFQPKSEGTATGSVTITDNAPGTPQSIGLTGQGLGKPALSASILGRSKSGTTLTATLQLTDRGTGAAQQASINQITLRTLGGTGTVTLSSPALPLSVGSLAIGASMKVTLTLNVPSTVTKFSLTEQGTLQNIAGTTFSFALAEAVSP